MKQIRPNKKGIQGSKGRVAARAELLQKQLTEVVRHRTAISEVVRVIASSPHDWQPIFDTIIRSATRLCRATYGNLRLAETQSFRMVTEVSYPSSVAGRWRQPIFNIPHGPLAHVAARKLPLHIPDLAVERSMWPGTP